MEQTAGQIQRDLEHVLSELQLTSTLISPDKVSLESFYQSLCFIFFCPFFKNIIVVYSCIVLHCSVCMLVLFILFHHLENKVSLSSSTSFLNLNVEKNCLALGVCINQIVICMFFFLSPKFYYRNISNVKDAEVSKLDVHMSESFILVWKNICITHLLLFENSR